MNGNFSIYFNRFEEQIRILINEYFLLEKKDIDICNPKKDKENIEEICEFFQKLNGTLKRDLTKEIDYLKKERKNNEIFGLNELLIIIQILYENQIKDLKKENSFSTIMRCIKKEIVAYRNYIAHNSLINDEFTLRLFEDFYFYIHFLNFEKNKFQITNYIKKDLKLLIKNALMVNLQKQNSFSFEQATQSNEIANQPIVIDDSLKSLLDKELKFQLFEVDFNSFLDAFDYNIRTQDKGEEEKSNVEENTKNQEVLQSNPSITLNTFNFRSSKNESSLNSSSALKNTQNSVDDNDKLARSQDIKEKK